MPNRLDFYKEIILDKSKLSSVSNEELQTMYEELSNLQVIYNGQQMSVKLCANSLYGACGNAHYRFCNYEVAADITGEGAYHMHMVDRAFNDYYTEWVTDTEIHQLLQEKFPDQKFNFTPIKMDICNYGDTDSRYVEYGEVFRACNFKPKNPEEAIEFVTFMEKHRIANLLDTKLREAVNAKNGDSKLIMELEIIGGRGIFMAKKKYVMSVFWKDGKYVANEGKIKATGVELKQSTLSKYCKDMQTKVIKALLRPNFPIKDVYKLSALVVKEAKQASVRDLSATVAVNKYNEKVLQDKTHIEIAPGTGVAHKAAAWWNNTIVNDPDKIHAYEPVKSGRIRWYYSKAGGFMGVVGYPTDIDPPEWLPDVDLDTMVQRLIITPLQRYLPAGSNVNDLGRTAIMGSFK